MVLLDIKKLMLSAGIGLVIFLTANADVSAQSRREIERDRQRIERENARYEQQRQNQSRSSRSGSMTGRTEQRINNASFSNGYQQGSLAGEYDRRKRKYNQSNVYRNTGTSPNEGDPTSSDYIYRQGYLQGYNDGYNGVRNY